VSDIVRGIEQYGAQVIAQKTSQLGESILFAGTPDVMATLRIGNAQAWMRLIADNEPLRDGRIYVRLDMGKSGGRVRVLTDKQVRNFQ
jgi:hypothetical protein